MRSFNGSIVLQDANKGMPPENLTSLKAFIAVRRLQEPESVTQLPASCASLPPMVRGALRRYIAGIQRTRFFMPDGKPFQEWVISCSTTWMDAQRCADVAVPGTFRSNKMLRAAGIAVEGAAREAERTLALSSAAQIARKIAHDTATDAALNAGEGDNAWRVSGSLIGVAEIMAELLVVKDLDFPDKATHFSNLSSLWAVFQKGYCLLGESDVGLVVFCKRR